MTRSEALAGVQVVDLLAAADELVHVFPTVAHKIRRLSDSHSAKSDLDMALDMVAACPEASQAGDAGILWAQDALHAMLHSAIVLYARATKSKSRHRSTLDIRAKLTADQQSFHEELCTLRDDAIAHYGPGETRADVTFHEERLVLPVDRARGNRIIMMSRRTTYAPTFIDRFRKHLSRVLLIVQREMHSRETDVLQSIEGHADLPALRAILLSHVGPASEVLGSAEASDVLLSGPRIGARTVYQHGSGWAEVK